MSWPESPTPIPRVPDTHSAGARGLSPEARRPSPQPRVLASIWGARGLWLGLLALSLALYGQKLLVEQRDLAVKPAIRWYTAGIILAILAWLGTYKNKGLYRDQGYGRQRGAVWGEGHRQTLASNSWPLTSILRYALAFAALGLNIYSAGLIHADYYSSVGIWGWVLSLLLLFAAFLGHHPAAGTDPDAGVLDLEDRTDLRIPRILEIAIFLAIVALALGLRIYRLDDWTAGMHGDEGVYGLNGIKILAAQKVSPFTISDFGFQNISFLSIALVMKLFGTGLAGLRMFSVLTGTLLLVPFYLLARMWFGVRVAIIAATQLSVSNVAIHFSRLAINNITTPFFLVTGFYFLFRGLQTRGTLNFVLSGYAFMFSLYYYNAAQLTPIMLAFVFVYLFVLMPLVRLPGVYGQIRRDAINRTPTSGFSRLRALRMAVWSQAGGVSRYSGQLLVFIIASFCIASPWVVSYADRANSSQRTQQVLIFSEPERAADTYQLTHDPLYIGVRMPLAGDIYPVLPVVFEKAPASVMVFKDGFWPRALWEQLTRTLSLFTYRSDGSSLYPSGEPIAKPIEAVLVILGIAWAAWRWRDTRMAVLSIWFWLTIFVGGVLTVGQPNVTRIIGNIAPMAIFAAITLNKLIAEFTDLFSRFTRRGVPMPVLARRLGQVFSGLVVVALLGYLAVQNYNGYYNGYAATYPYRASVGAAYFVRETNKRVGAEGRPTPKYYNLGFADVDWRYPVNAFLNYGTEGTNMTNPPDVLPVTDNGDRDLVFMVWDVNKYYLPIIKQYYPGGEEGAFSYGPEGKKDFLFTYYRVKKEQVEARRLWSVTYVPATGPAVRRQESTIGESTQFPDNLVYPVKATWAGGLVAPGFAHYRFQQAGLRAANLAIDGITILTGTTGTTPPPTTLAGDVILARGLHDAQLTGTIARKDDMAQLMWSAGGSQPIKVAHNYLWNGPGRGLIGEVRLFSGDLLATPRSGTPPGTPGDSYGPVTQRRVDGFLGFGGANLALEKGEAALAGAWVASLAITRTGEYSFTAVSNGGSVVLVDGKIVVDNRSPNDRPASGEGRVQLAAGTHRCEVRYVWSNGLGSLELLWTPPDRQESLVGPEVLRAEGGAWLPGSMNEPPEYQLPP